MEYSNVLFDLDGTLTDPYLGITNSVKYALDKFNITEENDNKLKLFIGPPLEKSFMEYCKFNKNDAIKGKGLLNIIGNIIQKRAFMKINYIKE
jgi:phosphoglycolate phosphatase